MVFTKANSKFKENRICEFCNLEFEACQKSQVFCSRKCKEKRREATLERKQEVLKWAKDNEEYRRDYHYRYRYGISLQDYNLLLEKQNNSCAICKKHTSNFKKRLSVDHDHKTREIFGLLCTNCNYRIIGRNRDSNLFLNASEYLKSGTGFFIPVRKQKRIKKRETKEKKKWKEQKRVRRR